MFQNILNVLDNHSINYEHVIDDESDDNDEWVYITCTDLIIEGEQFMDTVFYSIIERSEYHVDHVLNLVSEACMLKVVAHIIEDRVNNST